MIKTLPKFKVWGADFSCEDFLYLNFFHICFLIESETLVKRKTVSFENSIVVVLSCERLLYTIQILELKIRRLWNAQQPILAQDCFYQFRSKFNDWTILFFTRQDTVRKTIWSCKCQLFQFKFSFNIGRSGWHYFHLNQIPTEWSWWRRALCWIAGNYFFLTIQTIGPSQV